MAAPESDTTRRERAGTTQAEPRRERAGTTQHREGAGNTQAEPRRERAGTTQHREGAGNTQAEPRRVVSDSGWLSVSLPRMTKGYHRCYVLVHYGVAYVLIYDRLSSIPD